MNTLELHNIYFSTNKTVEHYLNIFLETNQGVIRVYLTRLEFENVDLKVMNRLVELDELKIKYGKLYIEEARRTYDNDVYILISKKFIIGIEYVLNSNFRHSTQEFRIIEDIEKLNKKEFDHFKELDIVELPLGPASGPVSGASMES